MGLRRQGPGAEGIYTERAQAQKELAQARSMTKGMQTERPRDGRIVNKKGLTQKGSTQRGPRHRRNLHKPGPGREAQGLKDCIVCNRAQANKEPTQTKH